MHIQETRLYHNLVDNDAEPAPVGFTRGIVAAALAGLLNTTILLIPIDESTKVELMVALNPVAALISFFAFGVLSQVLKKYNVDDAD